MNPLPQCDFLGRLFRDQFINEFFQSPLFITREKFFPFGVAFHRADGLTVGNVGNESVIATAEYGATLTAAVAKDNVYGCQFHPEKSGETGLKMLKNFWELTD